MRKFYLIKTIISSFVLAASGIFSAAQCPAGAATAKINWDNLDYLTQTGTYAGFVTTAMMQNQNFTIGRNRMTISFSNTITTNGENTTNTAEAGSFGSGADVEYSGNGTITISFDTVVYNLQFSLYDIDASQNIRVTATDPSATALNVNMSAVTSGVVTVTGDGTTTPIGTASGSSIGNTSTKGTVNISIAGNSPAAATGVKEVTITLGGTAGNFWLSEIDACVFGNFPNNYYASLKPWTGQPAYYLVTPDNNSVYMMNPLTGFAQWLFSEPNSPWVNSMAYDGVNHILYYVMDHASPVSSNKSLKKYDFNSETISVVIPDLTSLGIPLFDMVVESAGAAFYNGSLFLGIEGTNSAKTSKRKSIIWRIDFDAAQNPIRAAQVFAQVTDNGAGTLMHDWGDFTIKDGVLYDFNTGNSGVWSQFIHFDMQTGGSTIFNTNGNPAPIQAGQTWDGTIYWTGGQGAETGRVAKYNEDGTIGAKVVATVSVCSPAWVGRAGDASDPFKPKSDFGDAPDSYDPVPMNKATHEYDCNLRLGASFDREWDKTSSPTATADGSDEDGISSITILTSGVATYVQDVEVYNNTGATATLAGWIDYNGNGTFDPVEGKTISVPSRSFMQTITLSWIGIPVALPAGSTTFLRIRLTSASNGLTVNNSTGWFFNGEVEDYQVPVDFVLPVKLLSFSAMPEGDNKVLLDWSTAKEENFKGFDIERSSNGTNWDKIDFVRGTPGNMASNNYQFYDNHPLAGKSYYRLKLINTDETFNYSETRIVTFRASNTWMKISPNPVHDRALLQYNVEAAGTVKIEVTAANGISVMRKTMIAVRGLNQVNMLEWSKLAAGVYFVNMVTASGIATTRLVVAD